MTDKEIKKALECLFGYVDCRECPYSPRYEFPLCQRQVAKDTLALITYQQAEIKNLKVENQSLRGAANSLKMHYEEAQVEIERLRKEVNLVSIQFQDLQERYEEAQAEIERLKQRNAVCEAANRCIVWQRDRRDREIEELHSQIAGLNIYKSKIKAEAYKEFAERLKEKFVIADCIVTIDNNDIDNLVKEMVGEDNGQSN